MRKIGVGCLAAAVVVCLTLACESGFAGRPVRFWQPDELVKEADVVVIGTAQSTQDTPNTLYTNAKPETWVSIDTRFTVQAVLKGKEVGKNLRVHHRRYYNAKANITVVDGPAFVTFDPKDRSSYLLFLKRGSDGVLEPVTGQYDPGQSFNRLSPVER